MAKAMFGAGCFWGIEEAFRAMPGVSETAVGFSGGTLRNPSYHQVCSEATGHAEVVLVVYAPAKVTYADLLGLFWSIHNPTTPHGADSQYRSAIYTFDENQSAAAIASRAGQQKARGAERPITTQIAPAGRFWKAEAYHQQYFEHRQGGRRLGH
jgi:peptide-methionine (S)-S-oxide reductase